jgi:hypothetical protein
VKAGYGDFIQASRLNRFNSFCPYLVGYISGKNWLLAIFYWLLVIFLGSEVENLIRENCELACILGESIRTAQAQRLWNQ